MENYSNTMRPNAVDSTRAASLTEQALGTDRQQRTDAIGEAADAVAAKSADLGAAAAGWADGVKAHIRENPLTAVGIVAAIAYVWGATR